MECRQAREFLSEFIDKVLNERDTALLQEHLRICQDCRKELESLTGLIQELKSLETIKAPKGFVDRVNRHLDLITIPSRIRIPGEITGLAVTVVLALLVFNTIYPIKNILHTSLPEEGMGIKMQGKDAISSPGRTDPSTRGALENRLHQGARLPTRPAEPIQIALLIGSLEQGDREDENPVTTMEASTGLKGRADRGLSPLQLPGSKFRVNSHINGATEKKSPEKTADAIGKTGENPSSSELALLDIRKIISSLEGEIVSVEYYIGNSEADIVTVEISAEKYDKFFEMIDYVGVRQPHFPPKLDKNKEKISIQIKIITEE
ncbi:MAG: zf-HC2 domain-containing protein [Deltaproteobacteria bacterium]|nr:zf-HC2 domain-containing protein [Deltaproteobacteria bacterium]